VHKILLISVLLSPIVSGGVRPKPPGQTPLGHNTPCSLPFEGRLESGPRLVGRIASGVRYNVSFQQKYQPGSVLRCPTAAENGDYDQGVVSGGLTSPMYNVEPVTNISSSSCANNGRRTPRCAQCSPPSVAALFFTVRDSYMVDNTVDLYAAKPDIRPESRFLRTPPAFDAPVRGVPVRVLLCRLVWKN